MSHLKAVPDEQPKEPLEAEPAREEQETEISSKKQPEKEKKMKKWLQRWKKEIVKKKQPKKKQPKVLRQTAAILPFLHIHDDYILLKDGVMDIFQIETKNIHALNNTDLNFLLLGRARFLRSYFSSYKEVILNFPANTKTQRAYWLKKKEQTRNPIHLRYIEQKLYEFDFLEKERSNREFFFFIYAKDKEELRNRKSDCLQGMKQSFPLQELSRSKKEQVLFLLNNQNTKL